MTLVTVVIPVFNGADLVRSAIASVVEQTGCELEIIVVDDGSTDDTPRVLHSLQGISKVIRTPNIGARGIGRNRNLGARAGSGEWIGFLDHDDQWLSGKLERQLALASSTHADVVYTNVLNIGETDRIGSAAYEAKSLPCGDVFEQLLFDNFLFTSSVLVRREAFESVGGFSENGEVTEDWDLWLRLAAAGHSFHGAPEILTQYLWRRSSVSKNHVEARKLRRATVERALLGARAKSLGWAQIRRVRANTEATSAWFLADEYPARAILWYANAMRYWPFDSRHLKGLIKSVLRLR